jgi:hypothetical protein
MGTDTGFPVDLDVDVQVDVDVDVDAPAFPPRPALLSGGAIPHPCLGTREAPRWNCS